MHDLVIGGTLFQHKDNNKLTWPSPSGRDRNQIDHLMINGTWRRSLSSEELTLVATITWSQLY